MIASPLILADSDDVPVKLIGTVVVLIIWGIASIVSAVSKAREQARKRKPVRPAVKPVVMVRPRAVLKPPALPRPRTAPTLSRPAPAPVATPLSPLLPATVSQVQIAKPDSDMRLPSRAAAAPTPAVVQRWMSQGTIRAQFLLAEVFKPPVALRDPRKS